MTLPRKVRKGLIEIGLTAIIAVIGLASDNAESIGIGAGGVFVLAQVRRAVRDMMNGQPE